LAQGVLKSNLQKAFEALTPEQVFVIDMFYFEDVSQGDIAELLGVPLSTVEHHLRIAKLQLGKMIQVTELRELVVNRRPRRKVTHG
jgi:DNA-directed RNA polymerase specialized sigma24 family protein